ncbi:MULTISPECIES: recombinase RecA [Treponema]|uniref:Protein RecA n=1 Tax=Treponema succinifaciens (strain ATCC 33096 / DSM 2489 / 6091) TaxID=869209 RepID=F2NVX5_TRES6|nr:MULTISPECIES: recombinase RecA [Treponema]AEB14702.1 Protein recA [Treponema succinifaciens DSM 2489]MDD6961773.1 recombinase RecA [Treponema succinifaciens]MDY2615281.1 recombinase RecA [Treponema succinifaciens]MDY5118150.1 recombinase RecA [Treponema succinifaciens]
MAKTEEKFPVEMSEKLKALEAARLQIEKQFGTGSLMKLGTKTDTASIDVVPSGSILLDEALGIGGYPRGRVIEMYGPESSGKTTLALHAVAEAQKLGGIAAFIDAEHALDPVYAKNLGVNIDELWVSQPDTGEQALEICENLVRSGAVDIIVVDSVAALTPQKEIEGEMGDSVMGLQARLMSQALRKLTAIVGKSKCIVVFINQIRMKIGVMFGNPETTTGGNALKFYSSIRLEIRRIESIDGKGEEDAVGNRVRVKIVKNKVAPPFRKVELDIYFGKGISSAASILDSSVKHGLIDKRGAWYTRGEEKVGQGKENAVAYIENNPAFKMELENTLREKIFPGQVLRTKEGEVVTKEQILQYEKEMRAKGVGTGSIVDSPSKEEKPAEKAPDAEEKTAKAAKSKAASLAKAASEDKPVPDELF